VLQIFGLAHQALSGGNVTPARQSGCRAVQARIPAAAPPTEHQERHALRQPRASTGSPDRRWRSATAGGLGRPTNEGASQTADGEPSVRKRFFLMSLVEEVHEGWRILGSPATFTAP
jgi:hypothetical protein